MRPPTGSVLWLPVIICGLCAVCVAGAQAQSVLLHDFEDGTEGWENEAEIPVPAQHVTGRARRGNGALGFEFTFGPKSMILHCRVKEGFPRDFSDPAFQGFSAWVFIPSGSEGWESFMFARSGSEWTWNKGMVLKHLQPGWHRVAVLRGEIEEPGAIQDIGVQVLNTQQKTTSLILMDQVEAIMDGPNAPAQKPLNNRRQR